MVTVNSHIVEKTFIFLAFSEEVPLACGHILNSVQWITTVTYIAHSTLSSVQSTRGIHPGYSRASYCEVNLHTGLLLPIVLFSCFEVL